MPALLTSLMSFTTVSAQSFDKIIPMGNWLEPVYIKYSGDPIKLHFRTSYETAITFPEPITLYSVNARLVSEQFNGKLICCDVEINSNVMVFRPSKRMDATPAAVRGDDTGTIYELLVSSSPVGRRQPIEIR